MESLCSIWVECLVRAKVEDAQDKWRALGDDQLKEDEGITKILVQLGEFNYMPYACMCVGKSDK